MCWWLSSDCGDDRCIHIWDKYKYYTVHISMVNRWVRTKLVFKIRKKNIEQDVLDVDSSKTTLGSKNKILTYSGAMVSNSHVGSWYS